MSILKVIINYYYLTYQLQMYQKRNNQIHDAHH